MLGRLVVAAGLAVALACCTAEQSVEEPPAPLAVEVTSIRVASRKGQSAHFPATIVRDREAALSFRIGGQVRSIGVRIGDPRSKGQVVATLDATPFRAACARAEAEVGQLTRAAQRYGELVEAGAISRVVSHDLNGNRRTDTNFVGIPREDWGVSQGARPSLLARRFNEASFAVAGDAPLQINVRVAR